MNRIEKMIKEMCSNGVEYATLEELGLFYGGLNGKSKDDFKDGNETLITYMNVYSNISLNIDVEDKVKITNGEKQNQIKYGDVLFTGSSETPDECGISSVLTKQINKKLYLNSFCFGYRFNNNEQFLPDFTKYLFRSDELRKQIIKTASGVTRFNVSKEKMKKIIIPVPPIEIQREIVRILDNFTSLTAELTAELTARNKQYEYYRDKLLNDPVGAIGDSRSGEAEIRRGEASRAQVMKIKDFAQVLRGKRLTKGQLSDSNKYAVYHGGLEPLGYYDEFNREADMVMIINVGASAGTVGYCKDKFWSSDGCFCISKNENILSKYLYYYLKSNEMYFQSKVRRAGIPTLDNFIVEDYEVSIPPLNIQTKIVHVLNHFESICKDLNIGLPAEIEARKKQYEYYRDALLNFAETGNVDFVERERERERERE